MRCLPTCSCTGESSLSQKGDLRTTNTTAFRMSRPGNEARVVSRSAHTEYMEKKAHHEMSQESKSEMAGDP